MQSDDPAFKIMRVVGWFAIVGPTLLFLAFCLDAPTREVITNGLIATLGFWVFGVGILMTSKPASGE